ncbi:MAG: site-2 protease family protein [Lysinibacillus sp.]|nr:site-2 protease family protein [Lysinibacillus sp.]
MKESNKKTFWGVISIGALFLLSKMKWVLAIFKFLKLQTLISMIIYLGTYALLYGWKFAVALVYLLFVHEYGHLYAAKKLKLPTTPAVFIPFMGAVIGMKERPKSAKDEAFLAYMGPLFGLLAFLPAIPLYIFTEEPFWAFVIVLGSLINLFNLIPLSPLDGGRIVAGISTKLWGAGLVLLFAFAIWAKSVLSFIILFFGIYQWFQIRKEQKNVNEDRKRVTEYQEMLSSLKNIAATSSYEHLQYYAQSLNQNLKDEKELQETLEILDEVDEEEITDEEKESRREQKKQEFIVAFEREVEKIHNYVEETASYYKTEGKVKARIFFIYIGLVAVLGISSYLSFALLPPLE